jgi:hypothetical protein
MVTPIIAVDDASTDDTLAERHEAHREANQQQGCQ